MEPFMEPSGSERTLQSVENGRIRREGSSEYTPSSGRFINGRRLEPSKRPFPGRPIQAGSREVGHFHGAEDVR
jgi:hypothetical protein